MFDSIFKGKSALVIGVIALLVSSLMLHLSYKKSDELDKTYETTKKYKAIAASKMKIKSLPEDCDVQLELEAEGNNLIYSISIIDKEFNY